MGAGSGLSVAALFLVTAMLTPAYCRGGDAGAQASDEAEWVSLTERLTSDVEAAQGGAKFELLSLGAVKRKGRRTFLVLARRYAPGLVGLEDFSHAMVFYWFDRNDTPKKRSILQGSRRRKHASVTGVFATRSAVRPNLIAISTCRIIAIKDNIVEIDGIDAFDDSPVLDLKPYIPRNDSFPYARIPYWVR